jgi:hypothetical protein
MNPETGSEDIDLERLKAAAESLGEHFDTVQIFATRHEAGEKNGTVHLKWGTGNWFARYGQVREWVLVEEESARLKISN